MARLRSRDVSFEPTDLGALAAAERAIELAPDSPRRAKLLAEDVLRTAAERDVEAVAVAERALGLAELGLRDGNAAVRHLRRAVSIAERAELPVRAAEARMSLGRALLYTGDSRGAFREIDAAGTALGGRCGCAAPTAARNPPPPPPPARRGAGGLPRRAHRLPPARRPALGGAGAQQPRARAGVSRRARRCRRGSRRGGPHLRRARARPVPRRGRAQPRLGGGAAG